MARRANITSIDAVRIFQAALIEFQGELRDVLPTLLVEVRRTGEWIDSDRARYWPNQYRIACEAVVVARNDLSRCQWSLRPDDHKGCYEQQMALQQAKDRVRRCEKKVQAAKHWRQTMNHEIEEFEGKLASMNDVSENHVTRAIAALERMGQALEKYAEVVAAGADAEETTAAEPGKHTIDPSEIPDSLKE